MAKKRAAQQSARKQGKGDTPKRSKSGKADASAVRQEAKVRTSPDMSISARSAKAEVQPVPRNASERAKGEARAAKVARRPVGRPKGEPSIVINVRLPVSMLERLDRYLDQRESQTVEMLNRGLVIRELLEVLLEEEGL